MLDQVEVDELAAAYIPPAGAPPLCPDSRTELAKAARNVLRCVDFYAQALEMHPGKIGRFRELSGQRMETWQLTPELKMDILYGEPALYPRQKALYDGAFRGQCDSYDLVHWGKSMNVSSLRQRLYYHGKEIVLGGDAYCPHVGDGHCHPLRHFEGAPSRLALFHHPQAPGASAAEDGGGIRGGGTA